LLEKNCHALFSAKRSSAAAIGPSGLPWLSRHSAEADDLDIRAGLNGEAENDRGVASVRVALISGFVIVEEEFADPTIAIAADGRGVAQPMEFERLVLAHAPVRQALAL
jgi:hypothetical protein